MGKFLTYVDAHQPFEGSEWVFDNPLVFFSDLLVRSLCRRVTRQTLHLSRDFRLLMPSSATSPMHLLVSTTTCILKPITPDLTATPFFLRLWKLQAFRGGSAT